MVVAPSVSQITLGERVGAQLAALEDTVADAFRKQLSESSC